MNKVTRYIYKLFDKLFPPLKFNIGKEKELEPTSEDLDKWAEEYERKHNEARRKHRGTRN